MHLQGKTPIASDTHPHYHTLLPNGVELIQTRGKEGEREEGGGREE